MKKKIGANTSCRVREKRKKTQILIPKNYVNDPKARRLGYSNYQLKIC